MTAPALQFARAQDRLALPAGASDVDRLLAVLGRPEHAGTRAGFGDQALRGALADALFEAGRHDEEGLVRAGGHVVPHEGVVVPGRFNLRQFRDAQNRAFAALGRRAMRPYMAAPGRLVPPFGQFSEFFPNGNIERRVPAGTPPTHPVYHNGEENAYRHHPAHELPTIVADGLARFLGREGVDSRSPLWRHVKAIRNVPIDEPAIGTDPH